MLEWMQIENTRIRGLCNLVCLRATSLSYESVVHIICYNELNMGIIIG